MFNYAWCFLLATKKTYFALPGSSANFVITDIVFYVFLSSFSHSMEKILFISITFLEFFVEIALKNRLITQIIYLFTYFNIMI